MGHLNDICRKLFHYYSLFTIYYNVVKRHLNIHIF
jgi:hypothetical protein